ncbi:hypothetical protein L1887_54394 [Cichorium endivia]|nr:hypothetical protein L1887_54394 [Cichorium endivia]
MSRDARLSREEQRRPGRACRNSDLTRSRKLPRCIPAAETCRAVSHCIILRPAAPHGCMREACVPCERASEPASLFFSEPVFRAKTAIPKSPCFLRFTTRRKPSHPIRSPTVTQRLLTAIAPAKMLASIQHTITLIQSSLDDPSIEWKKKLVLALLWLVYAFETFLSLRQYRLYRLETPPCPTGEPRRPRHLQEISGLRQGQGSLRLLLFGRLPAAQRRSCLLRHLCLELDSGRHYPHLSRSERCRDPALPSSGWSSCLCSEKSPPCPSPSIANFVIEERYGFNKMTLRTFATDTLKEWLLGFGHRRAPHLGPPLDHSMGRLLLCILRGSLPLLLPDHRHGALSHRHPASLQQTHATPARRPPRPSRGARLLAQIPAQAHLRHRRQQALLPFQCLLLRRHPRRQQAHRHL